MRMLRALRFAANYFAAWLPLWAIYFLLIYYQSGERSLRGAFAGATFGILSAALLGLAVWSFATRLAHGSWSTSRMLAIHSGCAVLYTAAWTGFNAYGIWRSTPTVWAYFRSQVIGWYALMGAFIYVGIAGIAHLVAGNQRAKAQREAAERAEAMRSRAELAALRSQLNPHFLFNTLHSIAALVRSDPPAAEDGIERLAGLLRQVLSLGGRESDTISLAEEWQLIARQVELERLRFGDRLRVNAHLDEDALECEIPILTLQPLVENAIRHGITPREQGGTIEVRAAVAADVLTIEVSDDGVGMGNSPATSGAGTGLRSVEQRLLSTCGPTARLSIAGNEGRGTRVRMSLPARVSPARPPAPSPASAEPACVS